MGVSNGDDSPDSSNVVRDSFDVSQIRSDNVIAACGSSDHDGYIDDVVDACFPADLPNPLGQTLIDGLDDAGSQQMHNDGASRASVHLSNHVRRNRDVGIANLCAFP